MKARYCQYLAFFICHAGQKLPAATYLQAGLLCLPGIATGTCLPAKQNSVEYTIEALVGLSAKSSPFSTKWLRLAMDLVFT
jgi:hypothetical protein